MKSYHRNFSTSLSLALSLAVLMSILTTSIVIGQVALPDDQMMIFYRRTSTDPVCRGPMQLGEFIKRILSWEIQEGNNWPTDALKANAIAARTFTISPYNSDKYLHSDGQYYHCTSLGDNKGLPRERMPILMLCKHSFLIFLWLLITPKVLS